MKNKLLLISSLKNPGKDINNWGKACHILRHYKTILIKNNVVLAQRQINIHVELEGGSRKRPGYIFIHEAALQVSREKADYLVKNIGITGFRI